jgi:uncharacterized protein YdeI (BOF family)
MRKAIAITLCAATVSSAYAQVPHDATQDTPLTVRKALDHPIPGRAVTIRGYLGAKTHDPLFDTYAFADNTGFIELEISDALMQATWHQPTPSHSAMLVEATGTIEPGFGSRKARLKVSSLKGRNTRL